MMTDRNAKNFKYPSQLAIFMASTGGGILLSVLASVLIWLMMEGTSIPTSTKEILQPQYYYVNMVIQGVSTFFIFFLPACFFAMICYRKPALFLGFNFKINYKQFLLVILILILAFPLSGSLTELNQILPIPKNLALRFKIWETDRAAEEALLIHINSLPEYILSLFIVGLLPAVFEETFFRAGLQNLFVRWFKGPWIAIIITSIIFSLVHISYYGFLVRFGLGVLLGLTFYYSGSIWLSILLHFLYNGVGVTYLYATSTSTVVAGKDIEGNFPLWVGVPALIFIYYLFVQYKKVSAPKLALINKVEPEEDLYEWTRNQPQ